jgi:hypothetical protein
MNLVRLLTAARSLNEVKAVGRYHFPHKLGLPSFNFGKKSPKIFRAPKAVDGETKALAAETKPASAPANAVAKKNSGGWLTRKNPFAAVDKNVEPGQPTVQAELTLDKVQVVRNDLSDADFEVVLRQELPRQVELMSYRKPNKPVEMPLGDGLGSKARSWLGTRLFGAAAEH